MSKSGFFYQPQAESSSTVVFFLFTAAQRLVLGYCRFSFSLRYHFDYGKLVISSFKVTMTLVWILCNQAICFITDLEFGMHSKNFTTNHSDVISTKSLKLLTLT